MNVEENRKKMDDLDGKIKHARSRGALYHPTNPPTSWHCECGVFGKDEIECWSCGSTDLNWQFIPRFCGGVQTTGPFEE